MRLIFYLSVEKKIKKEWKRSDMDKFSVYMPGLETDGSKLAAQRAMHSQYVLQLLQLQRRAGFLCDITVNIEDKSFKAHKPLLAACSLYFRALFADSENAKTSTLNFDKLSASGFEVLLDYIYSGSLAITAENSDQVLYAANCLQMTNVVETCLNFIRSSFKVTAGEEQLGKPPEKNLQMQIAENTKMLQQLVAPGVQASAQPIRPQVPSFPNKMEADNKILPTPMDPAFVHGIQNNSHGAHPIYTIPNHRNPDNNQAGKALNHDGASQKSDFLLTPQPPVANPTTETLSVIMPYLVAKNARRPTLNEVRQLLLKNNNSENKSTENQERFALKQPPPALIPVDGASENGSTTSDGQRSLNSVNASMSSGSQLTSSSHVHHQNSTAFTISHQKMALSRSSEAVDRSNTNQTTAHTAHTFDVSSAKANSNEMQPFVLLGTENNIDKAFSNHRNDDDSSKGNAWSDDRSVGRDRTSDQNNTHLSGTPCPTNLTMTRLYSTPSDSNTLAPSYRNDSPTSYNSSPSIEISPVSSTTSDFQIYPNHAPKGAKCTRAQSLDFSKSSNHDGAPQDYSLRSASLSPRIVHPGDHSSLISVEQATNAVGALFAGSSSASIVKDFPSNSSVTNANEEKEDGRLIIDTSQMPKDNNNDAEQSLDTITERSYSSKNDADSHEEDKTHDALSEDARSTAVKEEYQSPTSPPPDDESFAFPDIASTSSATASIDENSMDDSMDDNFVLDLSIPKSNKDSAKNTHSFINPKFKNHFQDDGTNDLKTREALDALVMMQSSASPNIAALQQTAFTSPNILDENSLTHGLSRKPRRSSGGQTCQWPGCGRLFRHRNIYEEHRKLHEMGVPVTQLRKCYMGARVKKTARERLEEMRMVEGSSSSQSNTSDDTELKTNRDRPQNNQGQRATFGRKRNNAPYPKEGPDRKRVTVRDRKEHYMNRNTPWPTNQQQQSQAVIQHSPILGSAPSIPIAALTTDAMRQPWPSNQHHETNGIVGIPHHLLNHASNLQGLPTLLSPTSAVQNPGALGVSSNPAVVETLAALGIQIPTKRSVEESTSNTQGPPILSSPTSIMSYEHLRRAIASRDAQTMNYQQQQQVLSPTKVSRTLSTDGQILTNMRQPLQQALASLSQMSPSVTGNVSGKNLSPEKMVGQRQPEPPLAPTTPATHSYHGASVPWSNV